MKPWYYNEYEHCGVDYSSVEQAQIYDDEHGKFRDFEKEYNDLIAGLPMPVSKDMRMIDIGCGTGALSVRAAQDFEKIYAVDVSDTMLAVAEHKADTKQVANIEFVQAGFLSYAHADDPVDLVVSKVALHHLPDFWKQKALVNINRWLKTGGLFYLFDIIFSAGLAGIDRRIEDYLDGFEKNAGAEFRGRVETHIQKEYSTFDWVMEGMLKKAGFEILRSHSFDGFSTEILCRKISEAPR